MVGAFFRECFEEIADDFVRFWTEDFIEILKNVGTVLALILTIGAILCAIAGVGYLLLEYVICPKILDCIFWLSHPWNYGGALGILALILLFIGLGSVGGWFLFFII